MESSGRRRERRQVPAGIVHIQSTFNNTIITITDTAGQVVSWASSGTVGFKGTKKGSPFPAQLAAESAGKRAADFGMRRVEVRIKGPGSARETAVRALENAGLEVTVIRDVTPIPHNGCRPPKRRRV